MVAISPAVLEMIRSPVDLVVLIHFSEVMAMIRFEPGPEAIQ